MILLLVASLFGAAPAFAHADEAHGKSAGKAAEISVPEADAVVNFESEKVEAEPRDHDASADEARHAGSILKNLHPATVHFPIALFIMAALTELLLMRRGNRADLQPAVRAMAYGGAAGAVIAAVFGWIHTGLWFGGNATMQRHRWTGTGLAVAGLFAAYFARQNTGSRTALRLILFSIAIGLLVQAYLGGELAHGPHHLGF